MKANSLIFTFIALFTVVQLNAQSVGLVLSGGGAKGMAHIGVIKVLEENNIPIDYITGTSIGAIIGGLYAAGYTPEEMEELFKSEEFFYWSTGKIQKEYRYYFKQPELDPSWLQLRVTKKDEKVKLLPPTNIIPEEQMDFAFMELVSATNAACKYNFDSLMVPFLCVATDVNNSAPAILRKGDLGAAIRASMTVPLYFKPIEIDGKLLFDGGIVNNLPHDIMKDVYKPDIIIGHKVAEGNKTAETDDIMAQLENLVMRPTNFEIPAKDGILIETEFSNVGLLDFQKIEVIQEKGLESANMLIDSIKTIVSRRVTKEEIRKKRNAFNNKKPELYFQNIQVEGVKDSEQRKYIIQSLKRKYDVVNLASLKKEYFRLIADEHIKSIRPISRYNTETGYFDLHLKVEPEQKVEVNIGGNISTKPINQGYASFTYRNYLRRAYTLYSNIYFGRFYSSFKIGGRIDFPTSYPFYLSYYSTFNRWDYFSTSSELFFEDVRPPFIIQNEYNHRSELGIPLGQHRKLYLGAAYTHSADSYYQTDKFKKEDSPDKTNFGALVSNLGIDNNSLNSKQFATEGSFRSIKATYVTGKEKNIPGSTANSSAEFSKNHSYFMVKTHLTNYFKISNSFTLGTLAETVFSNKELLNNYRSSVLSAPGFQPTPHSRTLFLENFRANNYLAGGLKGIIHFNTSLDLRLEGFGFIPLYEISRNTDFTASKEKKFISNYYWQAAASVVYNTGVGPLSLTFNYYQKTNTNLYISLNFGYILFNKRGL